MTITFTSTSPKSEQSVFESTQFYNEFARLNNWNIKLDVDNKAVRIDGFLTAQSLDVSDIFKQISIVLPNCQSLIVKDSIGNYKTK